MPKNNTTTDTPQTTIPFSPPDEEQLDISTLETWLWDAACVIRGATDAPKFKDFILPLIFYKRLSDVFDDEVANLVEGYGGDEEGTRELIDADHQDALKTGRNPIVRFYIPQEYRWGGTPQPPRRWSLRGVCHRSNARSCPPEPTVAKRSGCRRLQRATERTTHP